MASPSTSPARAAHLPRPGQKVDAMKNTLRRFSDFSWDDMASGKIFEFASDDGERLAEVAREPSGLWKWCVILPDRFQSNGRNPCGCVTSEASAKKICEMI